MPKQTNPQTTVPKERSHFRENPSQSWNSGPQHQNDQLATVRKSFSLGRMYSFLIEPFAFLSILALYLEFPTTQDLIYTKICLQVISSSNSTYHPIQLFNDSVYLSPTGKILSADIRESTNEATNMTNLPALHIHDGEAASIDFCSRSRRSLLRIEEREQITKRNSEFWLKYQLIICILCALTGPYWGGMSDEIGRIIPLNVPIVSGIICNILYLLSALTIRNNIISIEWMIVCAIITGLSGGQGVVILNLFGYISDHSSKEDRLTKIIILEAIIFLANSFGFFTNAQVMRLGLSPRHPWNNKHVVAFSICILLNILCIIYSMVKLRHCKSHEFLNSFEREQHEIIAGGPINQAISIPDTINPRIPSPFSSSKNSLASFDRVEITSSTPDDLDGPVVASDNRLKGWKSFATLRYYYNVYDTLSRPREARYLLHIVLLAGFISATSLAAMMSLLYNYLRSEPFRWETSQYSNWNAIHSVVRGLALVGFSIIMKLNPRWDVPDPLVAVLGFASKGIGLLMIGLAESSMTLYQAIGAMVFSELTMPPIRSMLSKLVVREEICKVYACLAASQSFCFAIGNVVLYFAYTYVNSIKFFKISFIAIGILELSIIILLM